MGIRRGVHHAEDDVAAVFQADADYLLRDGYRQILQFLPAGIQKPGLFPRRILQELLHGGNLFFHQGVHALALLPGGRLRALGMALFKTFLPRLFALLLQLLFQRCALLRRPLLRLRAGVAQNRLRLDAGIAQLLFRLRRLRFLFSLLRVLFAAGLLRFGLLRLRFRLRGRVRQRPYQQLLGGLEHIAVRVRGEKALQYLRQ